MRQRPSDAIARVLSGMRSPQAAMVAGLPPTAAPAAGMRLRYIIDPIGSLTGEIPLPSTVQLLQLWLIGGGGGGGASAVSTSLTPTFGFGGGGGSAGNEAWLWIERPAQYGISSIAWSLGAGGAAGEHGGDTTLTLADSFSITVAGGRFGTSASTSARGLGGFPSSCTADWVALPGANFDLIEIAGAPGCNGESTPSPGTPPAAGGDGGVASIGRSVIATGFGMGLGGGGRGQSVSDPTWNGAGSGGGALIIW